LIRGTTKGGDSLVPTWLDGSFVSIGWADAGELAPGLSHHEIRDRIVETHPDYTMTTAGLTAGMIDRFVNRMSIGDLVLAPKGQEIYVGVVTSGPDWVDPGSGQPGQLARRREVEWANATDPIQRNQVSDGLYSRLRTLLTLTDVSAFVDELASIAGLAGEVVVEAVARPLATLQPADESLEQATLFPRSWLQEILDLLERKRQIVFYGPPGTSKTFIAQRLGDHIVAAGGNYRLVQFHPSYTYEDFFEGFRPRQSETGDGIAFELVSGPMRLLTEAAVDDPGHPYLLIIDEINRANIAKVFGELYFLLEYRDAAVSLLYSPDQEFTLPKNLYIIGTMNTADRSIALIDTAMRRRFYFVRFSPEVEPIASLLRRWLEDRGLGLRPATLLDALNRNLDDPDFSIGPSYFMDERILDEGELERVWTHALMPLLEEHFFGSGVDVPARFGLHVLDGNLPDVESGPDQEAQTIDDT
jgi:5-methylcytosine-specific restriction protein B